MTCKASTSEHVRLIITAEGYKFVAIDEALAEKIGVKEGDLIAQCLTEEGILLRKVGNIGHETDQGIIRMKDGENQLRSK